MSQKTKDILLQALPATIIAIFFVAAIIYAWTEPSVAPPGSNVAAPLNVSNVGQSKAGGLILNTGGAANGLIVSQGNVGIGTLTPGEKLDVVGYVKGRSGLCIGDDCRNSWPSHDQSNCYWKAVSYGYNSNNVTMCDAGYYVAGVQGIYTALIFDNQVSYLYCCKF